MSHHRRRRRESALALQPPARPRWPVWVLPVAVCLLLGACVAGSSEASHAAAGGDIPILLLGLWHGIIGPIMLIVEVVNRFAPHLLPWSVKFYEPHANSAIYDLGFYIGLAGSPVLIGSRWR